MDGDDEDAINEVQSSILMTKDLMAPMMKTGTIEEETKGEQDIQNDKWLIIRRCKK